MTELENIEYKQSLPLGVVRRAGKKKKRKSVKKKMSARRAELLVRVKRIKIVE